MAPSRKPTFQPVLGVVLLSFERLSSVWTVSDDRCLNVVWLSSERCLIVVWTLSDSRLNVVWLSSERCLIVVWTLSDCRLNVVWLSSERCLIVVWTLSDCRLNVVWLSSERCLIVVWTLSDCRLNVVWLSSERCLTVVWTLSERRLNVALTTVWPVRSERREAEIQPAVVPFNEARGMSLSRGWQDDNEHQLHQRASGRPVAVPGGPQRVRSPTLVDWTWFRWCKDNGSEGSVIYSQSLWRRVFYVQVGDPCWMKLEFVKA